MRLILTLIFALFMTACASTPRHTLPVPQGQALSKAPKDAVAALPDRFYFHQQDPRWSSQTLGGSGEPLKSDGCLVTAAAMALNNLGFQTDPGDLTQRLKSSGGFTGRGWLIWSGLEKVTGGRAKTRFFSQTHNDHVSQCLADGFYPLVRFTLPSRSYHWALVVAQTKNDFYLRDPMVAAVQPVALSSRASAIEAVRCIGVEPLSI